MRVRQVVVNLLSNAIKFTHSGEVALEIERRSSPDGGVILHFIIRDTGIGIGVEKQKLIFDAFSQADGTTTRKYGGTGLGLEYFEATRRGHARPYLGGKVLRDREARFILRAASALLRI